MLPQTASDKFEAACLAYSSDAPAPPVLMINNSAQDTILLSGQGPRAAIQGPLPDPVRSTGSAGLKIDYRVTLSVGVHPTYDNRLSCSQSPAFTVTSTSAPPSTASKLFATAVSPSANARPASPAPDPPLAAAAAVMTRQLRASWRSVCLSAGGEDVDVSRVHLNISGSQFVGNSASGSGGGASVSSQPDRRVQVTVRDSLVAMNSAAEGSGGGMSLSGDRLALQLEGVAVFGNAALTLARRALLPPTSRRVSFRGATTHVLPLADGADAHFRLCLHVVQGGGLAMTGGQASLSESSFSGNSVGAGGSGGGIALDSTPTVLDATVVANNTAEARRFRLVAAATVSCLGACCAACGACCATLTLQSSLQADGGGIFVQNCQNITMSQSTLARCAAPARPTVPANRAKVALSL